MSQVRLILALHNHQPVGNFDGVFEEAYRTSYRPFLDVLEDYPEIPFALHTSGPLLEWLVDQHPEYIARLRALVEAGRVEILGGGFFEPILTMIPHRDRVGQIQSILDLSRRSFSRTRIRGMWVARAGLGTASRLGDRRGRHRVHRPGRFPLRARRLLAEDDVFGYYLTRGRGPPAQDLPGGRDAPLHASRFRSRMRLTNS